VGHYDEMSTSRLTWVVLDRLVPPDDEAAARAALIDRDPELRDLVDRGALSEDQAIAALRARESRYRDPDRAVLWRAPAAAAVVLLALLVTLAVLVIR
jgi:hypothetical protein